MSERLELAGFLFSGIAIVVSVLTALRGNRLQERLVQIEERQESERLSLAKHATLRATFEPKALVIHNEGQASARSITLTLNGKPAAETGLFRKGMEIGPIAPRTSLPLHIVTSDGMRRDYHVAVTWDDDSGKRGSWGSELTIPRA